MIDFYIRVARRRGTAVTKPWLAFEQDMSGEIYVLKQPDIQLGTRIFYNECEAVTKFLMAVVAIIKSNTEAGPYRIFIQSESYWEGLKSPDSVRLYIGESGLAVLKTLSINHKCEVLPYSKYVDYAAYNATVDNDTTAVQPGKMYKLQLAGNLKRFSSQEYLDIQRKQEQERIKSIYAKAKPFPKDIKFDRDNWWCECVGKYENFKGDPKFIAYHKNQLVSHPWDDIVECKVCKTKHHVEAAVERCWKCGKQIKMYGLADTPGCRYCGASFTN